MAGRERNNISTRTEHSGERLLAGRAWRGNTIEALMCDRGPITPRGAPNRVHHEVTHAHLAGGRRENMIFADVHVTTTANRDDPFSLWVVQSAGDTLALP